MKLFLKKNVYLSNKKIFMENLQRKFNLKLKNSISEKEFIKRFGKEGIKEYLNQILELEK